MLPSKRDVEVRIRRAAATLATLPPFGVDVPWRRCRTPYRIFLAELLLVRTRVDLVAERFEGIYRRFPSPAAFAAASQDDVAEALASLGLRKRIPLIRRAMEYLVDRHDGCIPASQEELLRIPGVGTYAAAATAAFAFGHRGVPADVNVLRLLARITGLEMEHRTKGSKTLRALLPLLAPETGGPACEVVLDFARLTCKPRRPRCDECSLVSCCHHAHAHIPPASASSA
ncbi:MAG: hypothetical protein ISS55_04820 [Dehalococcoidales bacterium]|nr:hypothetical protein [Dehalococcoidales bacterium]